MDRSNYTEDPNDDVLAYGRYRGQAASCIRGKRGQAFIRELLEALDGMENKELISGKLINEKGQACAIGAVLLGRGKSEDEVQAIEYDDSRSVALELGIPCQLVGEIEFMNDNFYTSDHHNSMRWRYIKQWAEQQVEEAAP